MSSSFLVTTLLAVLLIVVSAHDEDFAFDSGEDDDFDVEVDNTWTHDSKSKELTAAAGKVHTLSTLNKAINVFLYCRFSIVLFQNIFLAAKLTAMKLDVKTGLIFQCGFCLTK